MAARIDPARWYWALGVAALSCLVGLLAGRDPTLAIAVSFGLGFLLLTVADLLIGVTIFTVASFLELATVASGVGIAKVLGLALAISWVATIVAGKGRGRFVWLSSPGLSLMIAALLAWGLLSLLWAESTSVAIAQMFRYGLAALLVPIVFTAVRDGSGLKAVTGAFVAGATFAAAYGLFAPPDASGVQGSVNATEQLNRIAGTVGDPNVFASVLLVGRDPRRRPRLRLSRLTRDPGPADRLLGGLHPRRHPHLLARWAPLARHRHPRSPARSPSQGRHAGRRGPAAGLRGRLHRGARALRCP